MYWGKILGAMLGFALGHGLWGAVLGVVVGHWADVRLFAKQKSNRTASGGSGTAAADDPYKILGVARTASLPAIKAAWLRKTREHHPDMLMAKGVSEDRVAAATKKMASINAAYDRIRNEREKK
jgi:DnaJ-domain-containing protein 1